MAASPQGGEVSLRISDLAQRAGVPVATIKFYLREGLLHPGRARNRTQSDYDESHVRRIHLIRALTDGARLSLADVAHVVALLEDPPPRHELLGQAQETLLRGATDVEPIDPWVAEQYGDTCDPRLLTLLSKQLDAVRRSGAYLGPAQLEAFTSATAHIAEADVASVPDDQDAAVRQVIVGTAMSGPVLRTMRLIAQQRVALRMAAEAARAAESDGVPDGTSTADGGTMHDGA